MPALDELLQRHPIWRGGALSSSAPAVPTGFAELDRELPGGGWPAGALSEILAPRQGIGELALVLPAAARLSWAGKHIVWLAPPHLPYAPALAEAGVDLTRLAVVRAPGRRDALWAAEQALRAGGCRVLLAWFPRARYEELRRLAIAVEGSETWVALFRPPEAAHEPTPAALRLALQADGDALRVHILKRRGAPAAPLRLPVTRPVHALGRTALPVPAREVSRARPARGDRRVGVPVHA